MAPNLQVSSSRTSAPLSRRSVLRAAAVLGLTAACGRGRRQADPAATSPATDVAYTGADVYAEGSFTRAAVVIRDGRIAAVGDEVPAGAEIVDATGLWLIPGVIDAHVHLQFAGAAEILGGGVTTVRDLGSPPGVADEVAEGSALRVRTAGRILTPVGGYPSRSWGADGTTREVRGPADAQEAVGEQVRAGASLIKVALEPAGGPLFTPTVLRHLVAAAHDAGLGVSAHVGSRDALAVALDQGIDELAHLPLYDVTPAEMTTAAQAGVVLVPTLEIRARRASGLRAVEAFLSAGGTVVYGTDLGNTGTAPGIERAELRALLDAGMSPAAVLDAATSGAADHLGLPDVGRLRPGAAADLVGLRANPLADVSAYDEVALVVAGGAPVLALPAP